MPTRVSRRAATHYRHARFGVGKYAGLRVRVAEVFAASKDRYGYRRVKAALLTRVSAKAVRRIMKEDGLTAHVSERRRHSSYEGETTPAPRQTPPTATSPPRLRTGSGRRTSPGSRPGTRRACLSPTVNRHDGKIVAYTAGFSPNAEFNGMLVKAAETLPEGGRGPWCIPTTTATAGGPDGWISWNGTS